MSKKVNSETISIWEVLSSSRAYSIPHNQRPYTWELKHWEGLWNSFFTKSDMSSFLGTIILLEDDDTTQDILIFDGQQRVTTLAILCKAFIDVLYDSSHIKEAQDIYSYLLADHNKKPRLNVSNNLKDYFKKNIQNSIEEKPLKAEINSTDAEKSVYKAYQYYFKQAKELLSKHQDDGAKIYDLLKQRLLKIEIVKLSISDVILGIEIFESVNATGKKLDASELAKNILIKHAQLSEHHDIRTVDQEWTEINDRLQSTGFSFIEFMHYFWISKYKYVGKNQLFQSMKETFKDNSEQWLRFFSKLQATSITIENIFSLYSFDNFKLNYPLANSNPKYSSKYLRYLHCLKFVKNKSWIIPLFTLLDYETNLNKRNESFIGKNKFHEILKKHFVFAFLHFNIFSMPTRDFTPAMYKLAKNINKALEDYPQDSMKSNAEVNKALKLHFNGQDSYVRKTTELFKKSKGEFEEGVHKIRHTNDNKYLIHNLYGDIEEQIFEGTFHNEAQHSIEHYMPQESEKSWGISKKLSKSHENRLGNIIVINASLNGELQNKSHNEKMALLRNNKTLNNFVKSFVKNNDLEEGPYNFGKITEANLETSHPIENPSEIDKRTTEISGFIFDMYISKMKY